MPQGLMEAKKQSLVQNDRSEEHLVLQERVEELSAQLTEVQEDKEQLQQGKVYLSVVFRKEYIVFLIQ
jgi:hypothetical protein